MRKNSNIFLVAAFTLIIPTTVLAIVKWAGRTRPALTVYNKNGNIRDFELRNQDGKDVSLKDWEGKIVVADFFFTHCPSICPRMTAGLREVQAAFPDQDGLLLNSFSVDPERDSIARLKVYATQFGIQKNWNLLTGSKKTIYELARNSFSVVADEGDGSAHDFLHSEKLVLLDTRTQIRGYYNGTDKEDIQLLIHDIKKLSDEK